MHMAAARGAKRVRTEEDQTITADPDVPELFDHEIHQALLAQVSLQTQAADVLAIVVAFAAGRLFSMDTEGLIGLHGCEGSRATYFNRFYHHLQVPIRLTHISITVSTYESSSIDTVEIWGSNGNRFDQVRRRKEDDQQREIAGRRTKIWLAVETTRAYRFIRIVTRSSSALWITTDVFGQTIL